MHKNKENLLTHFYAGRKTVKPKRVSLIYQPWAGKYISRELAAIHDCICDSFTQIEASSIASDWFVLKWTEFGTSILVIMGVLHMSSDLLLSFCILFFFFPDIFQLLFLLSKIAKRNWCSRQIWLSLFSLFKALIPWIIPQLFSVTTLALGGENRWMKEGGGIAAQFHSLLCCDLWQGSLVWGEGKTEVLEPQTRQPEVVQGNAWEECIKDVQNMIFDA